MAPCCWPFVAVTPVIRYSAVRYCFSMAPCCWPFVAVAPVIHYSAVHYCFHGPCCWSFVAVTPVIRYSAVRYCFHGSLLLAFCSGDAGHSLLYVIVFPWLPVVGLFSPVFFFRAASLRSLFRQSRGIVHIAHFFHHNQNNCSMGVD